MLNQRFIYICFFLSGAAGLMYEIIWTRFFSLTFGATTYSITTVLTAFMAGLALGSILLGKVADRVKQRLILYGWLELLIGLYALVFPFVFSLSSRFYLHLIGGGETDPLQKLAIKFALSFLIMLVPTTLMGGSLPVLSRFFIKDLKGVSSKLGILYSVNTFGAVAGTFLVGFYFLATFGLKASILIAATINIGIGIVMILYSLKLRQTTSTLEEAAPFPAETPLTKQERTVIAFAVFAFMISGFASLSHEVVWTRILSLIIASSTYAFSMILIGFLIGIALGSYIISHRELIPQERINLTMFSWIEIGIGISAFILIPLFSRLPYIMLKAFQICPGSHKFITLYQFFLVLLIVLVPTTLMGATLPVIARIVSREVRSVGASIGNIYFFNTFGAIFGSFFAGFFFIPYLGTLNTLKLGIGINILLGTGGLILAAHQRQQRAPLVISLVVAALALSGVVKARWDASLMDAGVSIYGPMMVKNVQENKVLKDGSRLLYLHEGINATTTVRKNENVVFLKTNGKTDASTGGDMATQTFSGYLPMMLHPGPRNALIIGLGSGVTAGTVAQFNEIESVDIVEIEPSMAEAAAFFKEVNHDVMGNPKVRMIFNDGRNHLLETQEKYDIIISEPSHPWISGVGCLFSTEFFTIAHDKLQPGGIFCQWMHFYNMSSDNFKMVVKTLAHIFEDVQLWYCAYGDILLIGSDKGIHPDRARIERVMNFSPESKDEFSKYLLADHPMEILGRLLLDSHGVLSFSEPARINSDNHPYLEFSAPMDMYRDMSAYIGQLLSEATEKEVPRALLEISDTKDLAQVDLHRSKLYTEMEWFEKAKEYIDKGMMLDERNENFQLQSGKLLFQTKQYPEAEKAVMKSLEINKTPDALRLLANILVSQAKQEEALKILNQNRDLLPDYEALYGGVLFELGRHDQAIPYLEQGLKMKEEKPYLLTEKLGKSYQALGRLDRAEEYYLQSVRAEEMNYRTQSGLANLYFEQGRFEEAKEKYLYVTQLWNDQRADNLWRLAMCYTKLNQPEKANYILKKVLPGIASGEEK